MKKIFSAIAVLTAFATAAVSCSDDDTKDDEKIPVAEVKVTPATGSVVAGTTLTLKAEILPENASDKTVEWRSRTPEIATVDPETGVVTGVTEGEAEILALCGGKNGKAVITVTPAPIRVEKIELSKTELALFVGKTEKLTYTINPENATNQEAAWDSSDKTVATIADDGTVTALTEGTTDITLTIDEKTATCKVTVSSPAIEGITIPYLSEIQGNTVTMTAPGFKAGDKVKIEAVAGDEYSAEADVANVTAQNATFELPATASRDRSYKLTVLRGGVKQAEAYLHPDDQFVEIPYHLGYYLTGEDEVVPTDPSMRANEEGITRRSYMPGRIVDYNEETKEFRVWKKDAALAGFTAATLDLTYATGVTSIKPLTDLYGPLTSVNRVYVANSSIESLDMTQFPNATLLHAWGDAGSGLNKIASINFGTYTDDEHACKVTQMYLSSQSLTGTIDLRNCIALNELRLDGNQLEGINLGTANGDSSDKDRMLVVYSISAKNNKLKEIDISNCGRLRQLWLDGNKIERARLLNNALGEGYNSQRPDSWFPYMYILKNKEDFTITWATAADAEGRERHIDVEHYWYRNLSSANKGENGEKPGYDKWVDNNPVIQALKDGFTVTDWSYALEGYDGGGVKIKHTHTTIDDLCPAEQDAE